MIHLISAIAATILRYSDFVLLCETTFCLFDAQEIGFVPRKTTNLVVGLRSLGLDP